MSIDLSSVFSRFFTSDDAGKAKTIGLLQEFYLYTAGEGVWSEPLIEVRTEADILVNAMYRDSGVEPPECPLIQNVHRLTLALILVFGMGNRGMQAQSGYTSVTEFDPWTLRE